MSTFLQQNIKKDINYLNKDFTDFRDSLINFAKIYFKDTITDFDPSDPAMMFIEMASYVGDVLSYYLDVNLKEMLLLYAEERQNVIPLAQAMGYKPKSTVPSKTNLDIYQLVPAKGSGEQISPDFDYALTINAGMQVYSLGSSVPFRTLNEVSFSFSSSYDPTEISIYQTDDYGKPTYYLLKKSTEIESGIEKETTFNFSEPKRFNKVTISEPDVISIDSAVDSDGNSWTEVSYLAQDTIFEEVENLARYDQDLYQYRSQTPYLLKMKRVPKRFITRLRSDNSTEIQFGSGVSNDYDEEILPNPDNVGLATPMGNSKLNYSWDIANFLFSDSYGQVPSNTTLTVKYVVGGGIKSNVLANTIKNITGVSYGGTQSGLDKTMLNAVKASVACNNPEAATGGKNFESVEEIRQNALAYFSAQSRAVTKQDYILRTYSMPQKFGSVAKSYIVQDDQLNFQDYELGRINPLAMNLYILSYNAEKQLVNANEAIKRNLSVYLDKYRILTDAINIKNAYVINIGVNFVITVLSDYSAKEILLKVINKLKDYFNIDKWQINQPIIKADIIREIANVQGVQSVMSVDVFNKFDENLGYQPNVYDIPSATRSGIIYPSLDPAIFEVRFPDVDIIGKVTSY